MGLNWEAAKRRKDGKGTSGIWVGLLYGHVTFRLSWLGRRWLVWIQVDTETVFVDKEGWPDIEEAKARADELYDKSPASWLTLDAVMKLLVHKDEAPPFQSQDLR